MYAVVACEGCATRHAGQNWHLFGKRPREPYIRNESLRVPAWLELAATDGLVLCSRALQSYALYMNCSTGWRYATAQQS